MRPRRGDHGELLRRVVVAVQRPEQVRVVDPVVPIVEEGEETEKQNELQDPGNARQAGRYAVSRKPVVDHGA